MRNICHLLRIKHVMLCAIYSVQCAFVVMYVCVCRMFVLSLSTTVEAEKTDDKTMAVLIKA